jgi:hypothetical protein
MADTFRFGFYFAGAITGLWIVGVRQTERLSRRNRHDAAAT